MLQGDRNGTEATYLGSFSLIWAWYANEEQGLSSFPWDCSPKQKKWEIIISLQWITTLQIILKSILIVQNAWLIWPLKAAILQTPWIEELKSNIPDQLVDIWRGLVFETLHVPYRGLYDPIWKSEERKKALIANKLSFLFVDKIIKQ